MAGRSPGLDVKYGEVTVEHNGFLAGEPVFVLRAKDAAAIDTLEAYRQAAGGIGAQQAHLDAVNEVIRTFRAWQAENEDRVRVPD